MALLAVLELFEHDVQRRVLEDKVARVLVELADGLERRRVLRVDEGQLFDEQQRDDVHAVALVDGNPREALLHDLGDGLEVEVDVVREHEGVLEARHDVADRLLAQF